MTNKIVPNWMPRKVHNCSTLCHYCVTIVGTTVVTTRVLVVYTRNCSILFNTVQHCATTVATTVPRLLSCIWCIRGYDWLTVISLLFQFGLFWCRTCSTRKDRDVSFHFDPRQRFHQPWGESNDTHHWKLVFGGLCHMCLGGRGHYWVVQCVILSQITQTHWRPPGRLLCSIVLWPSNHA